MEAALASVVSICAVEGQLGHLRCTLGERSFPSVRSTAHPASDWRCTKTPFKRSFRPGPYNASYADLEPVCTTVSWYRFRNTVFVYQIFEGPDFEVPFNKNGRVSPTYPARRPLRFRLGPGKRRSAACFSFMPLRGRFSLRHFAQFSFGTFLCTRFLGTNFSYAVFVYLLMEKIGCRHRRRLRRERDPGLRGVGTRQARAGKSGRQRSGTVRDSGRGQEAGGMRPSSNRGAVRVLVG
jgi:hypothetical protein